MYWTRAILGALCIGIATAAGLAIAQSDESGSEAEHAAIIALTQAWEDAFQAHDAEGLAALYTTDNVRLPNEGPISSGRSELAAAYSAEFGPLWDMDAQFSWQVDEIIVDDQYAFARGLSRISDPRGAPLLPPGKWVAVMRKESDGVWLYHWSTYNAGI